MELSAETLDRHPAIESDFFLKPALACLDEFHEPPSTVLATEHEGTEQKLLIEWTAPPGRTLTSKQRPDLVDDGAVACACLLLLEFTKWRITDIVQRGEGPDYWLGMEAYDHTLQLEVSGTDRRALTSILGGKKGKIQQLLKGGVGGYVAVIRFVEPRAHFNYHPPDPI